MKHPTFTFFHLLILLVMLGSAKTIIYAAQISHQPLAPAASYLNGHNGLTDNGITLVKVTIEPHAAHGSATILENIEPVEVVVPCELIFSSRTWRPFLNVSLVEIKKAVFEHLLSAYSLSRVRGFFLRKNPESPENPFTTISEEFEVGAEDIDSGDVYLRLTYN